MNLLPIEDFLNKARIARKSNQKTLVLSTKEYTDLYDSLASAMTRLSSVLDQSATSSENNIVVKMDGGKF
jgi:dsDNA-binding SOS-regulon protein